MWANLVGLIVALCILQVMSRMRVVVSGAGGKTGSLVYNKLVDTKQFEVVGLVRNLHTSRKLSEHGTVLEVDTTDATKVESAFQGADLAVLCTSAVPKINRWSLVKVIVLRLFGRKVLPEFYFARNGDPCNVDWLGAKNQIDAAIKAGVKHFVFLSSMGGTDPDNILNSFGRTKDDPKSGRILQWKRKAEEYLIQSGLPYTMLHPGMLTDEPGGQGEILLGVDDQLMKSSDRSIPREDVADAIVGALLVGSAARNRSIDIVCKSDHGGAREGAEKGMSRNWAAFFAQPGNCKY